MVVLVVLVVIELEHTNWSNWTINSQLVVVGAGGRGSSVRGDNGGAGGTP